MQKGPRGPGLSLPARLAPQPAPPPTQVFPAWLPAQRLAGLKARSPLPPIPALRSNGFLPHARAQRIAEWYRGPVLADARAVEHSYHALAEEVGRLARTVTSARGEQGLGVRVRLRQSPGEPYAGAAELSHDVRERGNLTLRAACVDPPHPMLRSETLDQLHTVHDVLGHVALGLGFDLQSEFAAWLYCSPLFSPAARPAAFCELAGAVSTYVLTGVKPVFRADLPPRELLASMTGNGRRLDLAA